MDIMNLIWLIIIGLLAGLVSGLVGVGGGIVIVPMLVFILSASQFEAQGTSIAAMLPPIGITAAFGYYNEGYINWKYAIIIAITFLIGGYFGSKIALSIDPKIIQKVFGILMAYVAFKMIFK
jgi:uncharacterized membrane protein YfcA